MIFYHGSTVLVQRPDILHSLRFLDFGNGFYVTEVKEQAEKWAKRQCDRLGLKAGFVNLYEVHEIEGLKIKDFEDDDDAWIDFVCECRSGSEVFKQYDIIKGKVADDRVFRVVEFYRQGIWDKARALKEFRIYKTYTQTAFITQMAIDAVLTFQGSYEVKL